MLLPLRGSQQLDVLVGPVDGREFVGVGIPPDLEASWTVEAVRTGRDPALEADMERALADAQEAGRKYINVASRVLDGQ